MLRSSLGQKNKNVAKEELDEKQSWISLPHSTIQPEKSRRYKYDWFVDKKQRE